MMREETYRSGPAIPDEMPANGQDWANHLGRRWNANGQIQIVLEFDRHLDRETIERAVRFSVDAEPILGCRFVENEEKPFWSRLPQIDSIVWCDYEEVNDEERALEEYLAKPFESEEKQLQAKIMRSRMKDTLCVKLNHSCCDGGGAKEYLNLLMLIYNRLCENPEYRPVPNVSGERGSSALFRTLGIKDPKEGFNPKIAALKPTWSFPHNETGGDSFNFSLLMLDRIQVEKIHAYAKKNEATMNNYILAAFYRAMRRMTFVDFGEPMEICVTIDLRRYLKGNKTQALCNLSGVINHRMAFMEDEDFTSFLNRVSCAMRELKSNAPGVHSAASMELMTRWSYVSASAFIEKASIEAVKNGKSTINLSNLGIISETPLKLGHACAKRAYVVTPAFRAPGFMMGVSNYLGSLTFTVGYYEPETHKESVEEFLNLLRQELLCSL